MLVYEKIKTAIYLHREPRSIVKGMQYMQERCLEHALQPLWLTSTATDNLHKVLNDIVGRFYFLILEKHGFNS